MSASQLADQFCGRDRARCPPRYEARARPGEPPRASRSRPGRSSRSRSPREAGPARATAPRAAAAAASAGLPVCEQVPSLVHQPLEPPGGPAGRGRAGSCSRARGVDEHVVRKRPAQARDGDAKGGRRALRVESPSHSSSISRSPVTTSFACRRSRASSARCFGPLSEIRRSLVPHLERSEDPKLHLAPPSRGRYQLLRPCYSRETGLAHPGGRQRGRTGGRRGPTSTLALPPAGTPASSSTPSSEPRTRPSSLSRPHRSSWLRPSAGRGGAPRAARCPRERRAHGRPGGSLLNQRAVSPVTQTRNDVSVAARTLPGASSPSACPRRVARERRRHPECVDDPPDNRGGFLRGVGSHAGNLATSHNTRRVLT